MFPILFSLYTNDCRGVLENCTIIKYSDDTVIIGKITQDNYINYLSQVEKFVVWCKDNYLTLNGKKNKEVIIDFREKYINDPESIIIEGETVERVSEYKYLGIVIDGELKSNVNTNVVMKKMLPKTSFY